MKKSLIKLTLGILVAAVNPLSASNQADDSIEKKGWGNLGVLSDDALLQIHKSLTLHELFSVSLVSKTTYTFINTPQLLWHPELVEKALPIDSKGQLSAKDQSEIFFQLFTSVKNKETVPLKMIQWCMRKPITNTNPPAFEFQLNSRQLTLTHDSCIVTRGFFNIVAAPDFITHCSSNTISFSKDNTGAFKTSFAVCWLETASSKTALYAVDEADLTLAQKNQIFPSWIQGPWKNQPTTSTLVQMTITEKKEAQ
jgi:hypothetical protein